MRKKISKFGIALVLLLSITGCTTPSQWIADAQVDELCAKDGGIKVYETVTLPKERFNQQGYFHISTKDYAKPSDEYYSVWEFKNIQGNLNSTGTGALVIFQSHYMIYRRKDQKVLGESIDYARRGGDLPLPAHPSSYSCYNGLANDLIQQIFLKSNN